MHPIPPDLGKTSLPYPSHLPMRHRPLPSSFLLFSSLLPLWLPSSFYFFSSSYFFSDLFFLTSHSTGRNIFWVLQWSGYRPGAVDAKMNTAPETRPRGGDGGEWRVWYLACGSWSASRLSMEVDGTGWEYSSGAQQRGNLLNVHYTTGTVFGVGKGVKR